MADVDVIVCGAGPAGAQVAMWLARGGVRVALLDRRTFPRFKACGEFMSPECLPWLEELGLREAVLAAGAWPVRGMTLHAQGRRARGSYGPVGAVQAPFEHGYAIRRDVLDELVLRRAATEPGVELLEGVAVEGLLRRADGGVAGVRARRGADVLELRAPWTVGADGLRSRVAGELGVRRELPWLQRFAFSLRYRGVPRDDHAEVHFFPGGYFAASSVDDGVFTVNLVLDRGAVPAGRAACEALVARCLQRVPVLADRLAGAERIDPLRGVGPLAGRTTAQTFDGAALVGDACGYVDPVTGEGLFFAMRGAAALAEALTAALAAGRTDRRALSSYLRVRRREIAPRLAAARWLQRALRHPRFVRGALAVLAARPRVADLVVAIAGDYVPGRELLRPSVWWRALAR